MSRSFTLATAGIFLAFSMSGCKAQEERRQLQGSITRLEERLSRMDEYVKSLQTGQSQLKQERDQAQKNAEAEAKRLREVLAAQEKATAAAQQKVEEQRQAEAQLKEQLAIARRQAEQKANAEMELLRVRADLEAKMQTARAQAEQKIADRAKELEAKLQANREQAEQKIAESQKRAQELEAKLQASRAQAEQKLAESQKRAQELEKQAKAAQDRSQQEMQQAKAKIATQLRDAEQAAGEKNKTADLQAKYDALRKELEQSRSRAAQAGDDVQRERNRAIERLTAERREVEKLRADVRRDLEAAPARPSGRNDEKPGIIERLQRENTELRDQVQALESARARAPAHSEPALARPVPTSPATPRPAAEGAPAPGAIIVNNEHGQVHFHFHGEAPAVAPAPAPARALAAPIAPARATAPSDKPPIRDGAKATSKEEKGGKQPGKEPEPNAPSSQRLIHGPQLTHAAVVDKFVLTLLGAF